MPWECPECLTAIKAEDYDKVLWPITPYRCAFCGLTLVREKATDQLIAAPASDPPKQPRKK